MSDWATREMTLHSSPWRAVIGVDRGTVSELFSRADRDRLGKLHRNQPISEPFQVLVTDDRAGLWLGVERLSVVVER